MAADLSDLRGHQLEYGQADPADSLSHFGDELFKLALQEHLTVNLEFAPAKRHFDA